jgi:hypothetical protein
MTNHLQNFYQSEIFIEKWRYPNSKAIETMLINQKKLISICKISN